MVMAVIFAEIFSFICSAASRACLQAGFIIPEARSRLSVPVFSSHGSSVTIGTCFKHTARFNILSIIGAHVAPSQGMSLASLPLSLAYASCITDSFNGAKQPAYDLVLEHLGIYNIN